LLVDGSLSEMQSIFDKSSPTPITNIQKKEQWHYSSISPAPSR
jgi:hypothetical protein